MTYHHDDSSKNNNFKPGKLYRIQQRSDSILYSSGFSHRSHTHNDINDSYILDREDDEINDQLDTPTEPLDEDEDSPFNEPNDAHFMPGFDIKIKDSSYKINPLHPATDDASNIDSTELYNEGLTGAVEASEPNAGNAVLGYNPFHDNRRSI